MPNQITGRVLIIRPTVAIPTKSGNTFTKRDIILDCTRFDPYTGERSFENTPCITFVGDRGNLLDPFQPGQIVTIDFDIRGRAFTRDDGSTDYATDIQGYRIALRNQQSQQQTQPQQPSPMAQQQQPAPVTPMPYTQPAPAPIATPYPSHQANQASTPYPSQEEPLPF